MKSVASTLIAAGVLCMVIAVQALPIGPKTLPQIRTNGHAFGVDDADIDQYSRWRAPNRVLGVGHFS